MALLPKLWRFTTTHYGDEYFAAAEIRKRVRTECSELQVQKQNPIPQSDVNRSALCVPVKAVHEVIPWCMVGTAVTLNIPDKPKYHGQTCKVIEIGYGAVIVELVPLLGGTQLEVPPRLLKPIEIGSEIILNGVVGRKDWDSKDGIVHSSYDRRGGVKVWIQHLGKKREAKSVLIRVHNDKIYLKPRVAGMDLDRSDEGLWWKPDQEQACSFEDSSGITRKFVVMLPEFFSDKVKASPGTKFPLLVYLHGAGGGTFFRQSKRGIHLPGAQEAYKKYVVISPQCTWNWKGDAQPWVNELVKFFRVAAYIDETRVFLTGCSMGGMGTWEIAADMPELYAGIAPVAAHHKDGWEDYLADQLRTMPIFAVHSTSDACCRIQNELPLWRHLKKEGATDFNVYACAGVDHSKMFDYTYGETLNLWIWFEEHRRKA